LGGLWHMAQLAQEAAESLDGRIEDERLQALNIEVSEELDAYQDRHG
jgi:hypothetical protein